MKDKRGHFNYTYKLTDKNDPNSVVKGWWVETTREESQINFWKSMIIGDATDGIKGIEGCGIKYAEKIFSNYEQYGENYEEVVFREYLNKYGVSNGIYEFQKNYRLLHMLNCDEDFIREIGELPNFPVINPVTTLEEVKLTF